MFSFITGVAVTAAVLMPPAATPDYQRGHSAGYEAGFEDGVALPRVGRARRQSRAEWGQERNSPTGG